MNLLAAFVVAMVPTLSVLFQMEVAQGALGGLVFALGKFGMAGFVIYWHLRVDKAERSWSPVRKGGLKTGAGIGVAMSLAVVAAWLLIGRDHVDADQIKALLADSGLTTPLIYLGAALYWIAVNSLFEEVVFRWFIFEQCERSTGGRWAVLLAAVAFSLHHAVAMAYFFDDPMLVAFCTFGVFVGGLIWSWLYLTYRSIWVPMLSHALVDVAVFGVGGIILLT